MIYDHLIRGTVAILFHPIMLWCDVINDNNSKLLELKACISYLYSWSYNMLFEVNPYQSISRWIVMSKNVECQWAHEKISWDTAKCHLIIGHFDHLSVDSIVLWLDSIYDNSKPFDNLTFERCTCLSCLLDMCIFRIIWPTHCSAMVQLYSHWLHISFLW